MKKSPELLLSAVIVILVIAGIAVYVLAAPHANAPTTATSTQPVSTTSGSTASGTTNYTDPGNTFSFNYPSQFNLSGGSNTYGQGWMVNSTADGMLLVKVTVPQSFEPKTNFVDANLTVGTSAHPAAVSSCLAAPASGTPTQKSVVTLNGTTYTKYVTSDAGAGNRYDTTSYRTVHNGQCYAVEYTIHYSNIENYPQGSGITQFDEVKVQNVLDGIVSSFKFNS